MDLKSLLLGLFAGALVMLVVAAEVPAYRGGRYQVAGSGAFFVIVDTMTGQAWSGDFHATINNPPPPEAVGAAGQVRFFQPKIDSAQ